MRRFDDLYKPRTHSLRFMRFSFPRFGFKSHSNHLYFLFASNPSQEFQCISKQDIKNNHNNEIPKHTTFPLHSLPLPRPRCSIRHNREILPPLLNHLHPLEQYPLRLRRLRERNTCRRSPTATNSPRWRLHNFRSPLIRWRRSKRRCTTRIFNSWCNWELGCVRCVGCAAEGV